MPHPRRYMKSLSTRSVALQALQRITDDGIKAAVAMDDCHVPPGERALLHELVYGVLRRWYSLEADMSRFCRAKPDVWARLGLLLGTYHIRHMRVPDHAAVGETVAAVKMIHPRSAGYVNAVLRKVAAHDTPVRIKPYQQAELPRWMYSQWRDTFGREVTGLFTQALQQAPNLCVAVLGERECWMEAVRAQGITTEAGELSPYAVLLPSGIEVTSLPGYREGAFTVMDQAAQAAVMALPDLPDGAVLLDLCAAPGGKTALLAHRFPKTVIIAVELNPRRIPRLQENMQRLGCGNVSIIQADVRLLPFADTTVNAVFLDAPCSASGVLRRHPDAKFLHDNESVERIARHQLCLAQESLRVLKGKATMLYAVCSIHPAENEQVIEQLTASVDMEKQASQRLFPSLTHDGFFFSVLEKPL